MEHHYNTYVDLGRLFFFPMCGDTKKMPLDVALFCMVIVSLFSAMGGLARRRIYILRYLLFSLLYLITKRYSHISIKFSVSLMYCNQSSERDISRAPVLCRSRHCTAQSTL